MTFSNLLRLALFCGVALPTTALAQAAEPQDLSEVVVTGSNVIRNGYQAPTPVTTVQTDQLQAATPSRLGEALLQLPQFKGSPSPKSTFQVTLGLGGSNVSLRNLGSYRTLVLVDGRRVVPTSTRGDLDLDLIPNAVIERVDVITGGASAQYGSDAVGGAVNLILDKKFNGIETLVQGGVSKYGDGQSWKAEVTAGKSFADDRGHVLVSYSHNYFDDIPSQADRPWGDDFYGILTLAGQTPRVNILAHVGQPAAPGGAIVTGVFAGRQFLSGGVVAPFNLGSPRNASAAANSDGTNQMQPIQSGLESDTVYGRIDYDLSDQVRVFAEGMFAKGNAFFDQGYSQYYIGTSAFTIFSDNAYLPASFKQEMASRGVTSFQMNRVNYDFGRALADLDNQTVNVTVGLDADLGAWKFASYASYGKNSGDYIVYNNIDNEHIMAAADAVINPANGQIVCRITLTNPTIQPGCVPINLFGNGSPSAAAIDYSRRDLPWTTDIEQKVVAASIRGEPFSLPAGPVAFGAGAEWREQKLDLQVDPLASYTMTGTGIRGFPTALVNRTGGFTTLNPQPASGSVTVKEAYGEVLVPVIKDNVVLGSIDLNAAARYTHYSTNGGVKTWKVGMAWRPIPDLRFRGTYSRDIRAPNLGELFVAGSASQQSINDPFQGGRSYLVVARGVPNASLKPEKGETYAIGVVLQPSRLPGFSASVDYFNISINGVIASLSQQQTVDACFAGSTVNCGFIQRGGPNNDILNLYIPAQNLSKLKTSGVDVDVSYRTDLADGQLALRGFASFTPEYITQSPGLRAINYAGEIQQRGSLPFANPEFTGLVSANYTKGSWSVIAQERFVGSATYDNTFVEGVDINDNSVPAVFYTDLTLQYRFEALGGKQTVFATVNNLFNKAPPLFPSGSVLLPTQYNRSVYDGVGRYFTAGLKARF